jgi:acetylornithine deacetylase/succinyl-diaminopimelate desuccinylase
MSKMEEISRKILRHLDAQVVFDLTRHLVSIPSHTPDGEEMVATAVEEFLSRFGVPVERQRVGEDGVNVIARLPARGDEEAGLMLNGHLDTVPPSDEMPFPPFEAILHEGKMWGRGTADMKGGIAAMLCGMVALHMSGIPLQRPLLFTGVASEERGNLGTDALIRSGVRARWAVVGEATGLNLVTAHKGVDRYRITVEGRAAHESMPELGVNAIIQAAEIISSMHGFLWSSAQSQTHPQLGQAVYNIGTIQGGTSRNTIPARCTFQIGKRYLPGDSPAAIQEEIQSALRKANHNGRVIVQREPEFDIIPHPPLFLPEDHPLVRMLMSVVECSTGRVPQLESWGAFTDGALLQEAGIPAVIFGPGDVKLAHSDAEHISLSELVSAAEVYALLAAVVCGRSEETES